MKEITEEIKREVVETHTMYEATDGTRFENQEECKKYEEGALGMLRARVKPLMSAPKDAWATMGGYDDHQVVTVRIESEADYSLVLQWFFTECPWYLKENDVHKEQKQKIVDTFDKALINKDVLIFGRNCDDDYYFINSRQNIINNINNLDKEEKDA